MIRRLARGLAIAALGLVLMAPALWWAAMVCRCPCLWWHGSLPG